MKRCLSEKALLLLHSGEGSESDRAHLEGCLICARRYRQLAADLGEIIAALKRAAPESTIRERTTYSGLRWSWAIAAIVVAFLGGKITDLGVFHRSGASVGTVSGSSSEAEADFATGPVVSNDGGIDTPASFGLYVDELISQEDNDQDLMAAPGNEDADTSGL